jgi:hypothetical protein
LHIRRSWFRPRRFAGVSFLWPCVHPRKIGVAPIRLHEQSGDTKRANKVAAPNAAFASGLQFGCQCGRHR